MVNLNGSTGSIQWEESTDGMSWNAIGGQTSASLVAAPSSTIWYRAMVTDGTCDPIYSDTTHVVLSNPVAYAGNDVSICSSTASLGSAGGSTGGIAPYTYSWSPAAGLSSTSVANPDATPSVTTTYMLQVTDSIGCVAYDTVVVTVGAGSSGLMSFGPTGTAQTFTVPPCVTSITIECFGAQGGAVTGQNPFPQGGLGAHMVGTFAVNPGDVLTVVVGQRGNSDPSSSGGGGGSGVGVGTTPWIVAGGGAGVDFQDPNYAGQHAVVTNDGVDGNFYAGSAGVAGGDGLDNAYTATNISRGGRGWLAGNNGSSGMDGLSSNTTFTQGTHGLGGGGGSVGYGWCNCGGGGGGYSGGGSGGINQTGGGGGSYNVGTNQNNTGGVHSGAGEVIISW